jgi:hypothetical protein
LFATTVVFELEADVGGASAALRFATAWRIDERHCCDLRECTMMIWCGEEREREREREREKSNITYLTDTSARRAAICAGIILSSVLAAIVDIYNDRY